MYSTSASTVTIPTIHSYIYTVARRSVAGDDHEISSHTTAAAR
jgi:hypothetical protein